MEVLQIVARPLAARFLRQDVPPATTLAPLMDLRQVLEEEARSLDEHRPRTVAIHRQGIDTGLDIGEVLPKQTGHVGV
jgi:hypothetical protein